MSDAELYKRQGMGNRIGFGKKAALVLVDFTVGFNDPNAFGGGNVNDAVQNTVPLLAAARRNRVPVAYTRVMYAKDRSNVGVFATKNAKLADLTMDNPLSHVVPELTPIDGEYIIDKTEASAFLGTGFASWLAMRRIDTLVITGATTSGCVRATVVDACGHNLRPIIARDCVGDRALGPHEASLFDMDQKYGDVMGANEIIAAFAHQGGK